MKIGIISIASRVNYGNRLQNYALSHVLVNMGHDVISGLTIMTRDSYLEKEKSHLKRMIKSLIPWGIIKKRLMISNQKLDNDTLLNQRRKKFDDFTKKFIKSFPALIIRNESEINNLIDLDSFGCFITGSDQVWNPYFAGKNYHFLTFVGKEKRYSYAASFGVNEIPQDQAERYQQNLKDMNRISVRETQAVDLVKKLIGNVDVEVDIDPTLLLTGDEWLKIEKKPIQELPEHYVLTYFLGDIPETVSNFTNTFLNKNNISIININRIDDSIYYSCDPSEFIYLFRHADFILTDSFHGTVFSIIFHRRFRVFKREEKKMNDMFSRIDSLLELLSLEGQIDNPSPIEHTSSITTEKWTAVDYTLSELRKKSINRLMNL